jgi:hypothetical protein
VLDDALQIRDSIMLLMGRTSADLQALTLIVLTVNRIDEAL